MIRGRNHQAGSSRPPNQSPDRGPVASDHSTPMLSATSSNNHSLFSFGRSNAANATRNAALNAGSLELDPVLDQTLDQDDNDPGDRDRGPGSLDFLPSVSFDDLQSSLESASSDFKLTQFPASLDSMAPNDHAAANARAVSSTSTSSASASVSATASTSASASASASAPATRIALPSTSTSTGTSAAIRTTRAGILRRPSISNRQSGIPASTSIPDPTAATAASRQRRQSHYPPVSNTNITKPPRKSVGPGLFDPEYGSVMGRTTSRRRPSLASNSDGLTSGSNRSSIDGGARLSGGDFSTGLAASRATKARSFQPPGQKGLTPSASQEHFRISGPGARTPRVSASSTSLAQSNSAATITGLGISKAPAAANRLSAMPPVLHPTHATGLGARTVSPTDARRLKRMSVMPPSALANGVSCRDGAQQLSSVPLPLASETRASSRSPSMLPRKSLTPSSSRTTPEANRKSYNSGLSAASSTSYNTVRTSTGSVQTRLPQGTSTSTGLGLGITSSLPTSRLPAPKTLTTRTSMSNLDDDEYVPPVPAIPKAYESPKGSPAELSFLEKRKSNLTLDTSSIHSSSTASLTGSHGQAMLEPPAVIQRQSNPRLAKEPDRTAAAAAAAAVAAAASSTSAHNGHTATSTTPGARKTLQPLRLPPMNLMPLSMPTTAKIAALQEKASFDRNLSPPPSRVIPKTPTTPMTASKGLFYSRYRNDDDAALRSTSSIHQHHSHSQQITPCADDTGSSSESIPAISTKASFVSSSSAARGSSTGMDSPVYKRPQTEGANDRNDRDADGYDQDNLAEVLAKLPGPPPIPATPHAHKPSGPRAPAPTPSRAFAAIEAASAIVYTTDPSPAAGDEAPPSATSTHAPSTKASPTVTSPEDPPTPSSIGSSLRRKLSLSWKRNKSGSTSQQQQQQQQQQPADGGLASTATTTTSGDPAKKLQPFHARQASMGTKHEGMPPPPPRIPISATMNSLKASPTPAAPATAAISSRTADTHRDPTRRKTSASSLNAILALEKPLRKSDSWTTNGSKRGADAASTSTHASSQAQAQAQAQTQAQTQSHAHAQPQPVPMVQPPVHNASVIQKILKPKSSAGALRHQHGHLHLHQRHGGQRAGAGDAVWTTADLDKDDLVAEEEIRKLGMRRKETELAARTLDALRKRATPKERVSPQEAIRIAMLNIYERGEIVDYNDVYFCGTQNAAKVVGNLHTEKPNFGYDDERGDYAIVPGDHLAFRYEIIDMLGKGSFGQVVRCIDHKTGVLVAVKIIRNKKRFHQQALVEVNILQKLREWDPSNKHSMVNFTHSFYFRGHLCISTELLDMNLYEFTKANGFRGFSLKMIRRFTKQLLSSLNLLKQHRVIHCDLKPENILLRHPLHTEIKMIDFGSSCFENEKVYTYIQSRFYRSPEVILGMTYGMPIDMWSLGCILAELYTGVPIFPGENEQEQLACIMEVFGPPEKHLIEKSTRKKLFFDSMGKPRLTVSSKGRRRRPSSKTLQQAIKCDDEVFLDFLARCLRWDPDRRLKPDDAVRHPFITGQKLPVVPRGVAAATSRDGSPIRRHNTIAGGGPRPLPDPPGSNALPFSSKLGSLGLRTSSGTTAAAAGASPHKSSGTGPTMASTRRASAVAAAASNGGSMTKRTSGGQNGSGGSGVGSSGRISANGGSSLPRASGRVASGSAMPKTDLAAAGAAAAMTRRAG